MLSASACTAVREVTQQVTSWETLPDVMVCRRRSSRANPFVSPYADPCAARSQLPAKRDRSIKVSANQIGSPCKTCISDDHRRRLNPKTREARFGTRPVSSTTQRVVFAMTCSRACRCVADQPSHRSRTPTLTAPACQPNSRSPRPEGVTPDQSIL